MDKSKDKRIKKLKKKHIWPSILGLVLLLFIFLVIFIVVMAMSVIDVVQRKVSESGTQSVKIAKMYEDYNETNADSINESVLTYIELSTGLEAVGILDENGEKLWSSSERYPVKDNAVSFDFVEIDSHSDIRMIIEEDESQIFTVENDTISISKNIIDKIDFSQMLNLDNIFTDDESKAVFNIKLWIVIPVNGMDVCILNNVCVWNYDLFMLIMSVILFSIIIIIFALYYLVSVIGVIWSMRRTTKIIYTDMVTGGDNWLYFVKKATSLLKKNRNNKFNYAMLHIKMRKYRSFCTCLGVREGEELIEKFYYALKKKIKNNEAMAHRENAEFGLLITYTDIDGLLARVNELEAVMNAILPSMKLYFGVGVYQVEAGERDVEQLYNNALLACDMLSDEVQNQIAFFDIEMNKQKLWERKVEDDMERALMNREFKVYLQPKISTAGEELAGAEALVRWIHPTEGFIPPNKFIPIFEKNGFILKLDDYMLREIARQQAQWMLEGRKIVPISVNISRAHFTREDLAEHICNIVDKFQVPHNVIELELTESAFFDDKYILLNTVKKLRNAGFIVSMDDFGAGYSSLNSLKELNIDVLKIDADFFRGTDTEERGMLIVSEVIDLAKKLNMKIVAEGIESREQVDFLAEQECDLIQGYFFAKPMPIDEFVEKYNGVDK